MVGSIKHIVVFQSLPDGEKRTGNELYSDCIKRRIDLLQDEKIKMTHQFFDVINKSQLVELIKYYQYNAEFFKNGLLFHFEMHGIQILKGLYLRMEH